MSERDPETDSATAGPAAFDERLSVPVWWYLLAVGLGVLMGAQIHMGYPGLRAWLGYLTMVPLCVGVLWWMGRSRVTVRDGVLVSNGRELPLSAAGVTDTVARADKQQAMGPDLDPQAYVLHRAWVGPLVRVQVIGRDEPYWVLSTRRPDELRAAIAAEAPHPQQQQR
ncbi:putative CONSERVED ALANINE RICH TRANSMEMBRANE PROTEIN [Pseudonocardia sp. Ae406_Ps2]|uniref:DUF3093 domain-containing protein n=1 Tax=unclassified Pseudonocardia TaxID=2619320 RepID=UPI00094B017A|nr:MULTISPECIES: DUF3093 domain-containing protein [unclassified Pseudonocardia]OLM00382.1 putative CONSERVED ALANINE RICH TRANSMEMBRANE PROTEIN [Pseudonocardia sp. Ae406_Ps2]OLM07827.1 putative CONSERVED ALANINE RICH TRANSMEMBRANE PROTEIN [Pseudonocardia sp. Ae331_Ps2]OLM13931.1 putative CONSERVED ALANINE RICH TRANSMEMBRANE PROTEIN [Pseudonocardia sp. Ae505_Ps2]OLM21952.1 putative CONSERVED ALANINE RICH TRANSMEMBRANE PROTEIN [Pseudonocardia sp. Ae706_Ps2]